MKTIEELYQEVLSSEELKKEFLTLKPEDVEGFAASHGCQATLDDIRAFFEAKNASGPLSDDELDQIAGGKGAQAQEAVLSIMSAGVYCGLLVVVSLAIGDVGTGIKGDGMLCAPEQ